MQDELRSKLGWGLTLLWVIGALGCVPHSSDFKLSKVGPHEAAIAGRLTILYNGQVYTENCFAIFSGRKLRMDRDGIVLLVVPEGHGSLERVECKDLSLQHVGIKNVHFVARGNGVVTDIGDIAVTWQASGGLKATALFGLIGGAIDEAIDDGVADAVVRPPVAEVRAAFKAQTGVAGAWSAEVGEPVAIVEGSSGFYCTGTDSLSLCMRTAGACEQIRSRLPQSSPPACEPGRTAWCFATDGRPSCSGTEAACESQRRKFDGASACREER